MQVRPHSRFQRRSGIMLHLLISFSSYLLFLLAKTLMPTQPAPWRIAEQARNDRDHFAH